MTVPVLTEKYFRQSRQRYGIFGVAGLVRVEAATTPTGAVAVRPYQALEPLPRFLLGREAVGEFQE